MDARLHELLDVWEEFGLQGTWLNAEALRDRKPEWFRETPELFDELKKTMQMLEAFQHSILDPQSSRSLQPDESFPEIAEYRIERLVGVGGMGRVYLATDIQTRLTVALKVLQPQWGLPASQADRSRFAQEAKMLELLQHPHIVRMLSARARDDQPFFVMEYLPRSLADPREQERLRQQGLQAIVGFMLKVVQAVEYAHAHGVLHRDLKPANILIDTQHDPRICDFGLAKLLPTEFVARQEKRRREPVLLPDPAQSITGPGSRPGTPAYMSPEQYDPTLALIGPASDVWALGVILYELLAGERPFAASKSHSLEALREALQTLPEPFPIPAPLDAICRNCLAYRPGDRYATAAALALDLERWLCVAGAR